MSCATTVIASALAAVALEESFTCTVKLLVPAAVGVPVIAPAEERESPAGSVPADMDH